MPWIEFLHSFEAADGEKSHRKFEKLKPEGNEKNSSSQKTPKSADVRLRDLPPEPLFSEISPRQDQSQRGTKPWLFRSSKKSHSQLNNGIKFPHATFDLETNRQKHFGIYSTSSKWPSLSNLFSRICCIVRACTNHPWVSSIWFLRRERLIKTLRKQTSPNVNSSPTWLRDESNIRFARWSTWTLCRV